MIFPSDSNPPPCLSEGRIEWGRDTATISVKNSHGAVPRERLKIRSREQFVGHLQQDIATRISRVRIFVILAEEDGAIAMECWKLAHEKVEMAADWGRRETVDVGWDYLRRDRS